VIIQGSGDIGLIMARRLTIEGYQVLGVFERLPYLSGLVRNKVQCLDHFDIPLRFGTQICEIVGKGRVEGVFAEKVDNEQRPIAGSREYFPCDTVLFSVGLIPEVDILKSAGLAPLPGRSVVVNSSFETGVAGIFLCGNALHIHDLADNAAKEGESVAHHVAQYLRSREEYAAFVTQSRPYKPLPVNTRFNAAFFTALEGSGGKVCIVCPKGCAISAKGAPCPRGAAYFVESEKGRFQTMTTTINALDRGSRRRLPIKSLETVEVAGITRMKMAITLASAGKAATSPEAAPSSDVQFSVNAAGKDVRFSICV